MYKILIADDEPISIDAFEYIIKHNDVDAEVVARANSGREAVEKACMIYPDIVFIDIMMPGINGLEAIRQIKDVNQNTHFVIISAHDIFDYASEAMAMDVDEYLIKPVKEQKFLETLERVKGKIDKERSTRSAVLQMKEKLEMIVQTLDSLHDEGVNNIENQILHLMIASKDAEELKKITIKYIDDAVAMISSKKKKKINSIVEKANNYLLENYANEITLEDVAREVNLSPYYFSRFYKEQSGMNFIDHLTHIRVEKAKELFSTTELSLKEVSFLVGYSDPSYFSKLFKKTVGQTASEYKERL